MLLVTLVYSSHPTYPPPLARASRASYGETSPKRPAAAEAGPTYPTFAGERQLKRAGVKGRA